jgi:acetyl-CoA carboxylase carboxyl transferase subunit beta
MALFRRKKYIQINPTRADEIKERRAKVPDGLAERCPKCGSIIFRNSIEADHLCPKCGYHLQFPAQERVKWLVDDGSFVEWDSELVAEDPLDFPGYQEKIDRSQKTTRMETAVLTGEATLEGLPFVLGVMDSRYMMASMGTVVGEKLTRLFERATEKKLPVVLFIASGGARMQEGILSLMQMAKISQAISKHSQAGLFYCTVLTHPTTGGVTGSFAMQGDVTLAEPDATIGFAGKRVIEQNINANLPEDFQAAETVLEYGFIDNIIPRSDQHQSLHLLLAIHQLERQGD